MKQFSRALALCVAAALFAVLCSGCIGTREDFGVYSYAVIRSQEEEFDPVSVYGGEAALELKALGRATLTLGEESYDGQWESENGSFALTIGTTTSSGTLESGVCTLTLGDTGKELVFLREGAAMPQPVEADTSLQAETALQQAWNGGWYGWWEIRNAEGDWAALDRQRYDLFARITLEADGAGIMRLWDEEMSESSPMCEIEVLASQSEEGILRAVGGKFWLAEINAEEWTLDRASFELENTYVVKSHYACDEGSFDYTVVLRPWGASWEDIELAAYDMLPYYYKSWYLPAIEAGESLPADFDIAQVKVVQDSAAQQADALENGASQEQNEKE